MRRITLLVVMLVALSACWEQAGFDAGRSGYSPLPTGVNTGNVASLAHTFTASPSGNLGSEIHSVLSGGHLFLGGPRLLAYDAAGKAGCSGPAPAACTPQWSSQQTSGFSEELVVGGGKVWGITNGTVLGYDAGGVTGCSGTPRVCAPIVTITPPAGSPSSLRWTSNLIHMTAETGSFQSGSFHDSHYAYTSDGSLQWQADLGTRGYPGRPSIADGDVLFVMDATNKTVAYDGRGTTGCSGTPTTCSPLWRYNDNGPTAARAGRLYSALNGHETAYDSKGVQGCSGAPKVCQPLWSTSGPFGQLVVTADHLYVTHLGGTGSDVYALDGSGCSDTPTVCQPAWTTVTTGTPEFHASVAGGVQYTITDLCTNVGCDAPGDGWRVQAHDANGSQACTGSPKVCQPLWTAQVPFRVSEVMIVGDVVYIPGDVSLGINHPQPAVWAYRVS